MTSIDATTKIADAIEFNCRWYSSRAQRYKRIHFLLQSGSVFLPLITMLVELNFHFISLNLALLLLVSALASVNIMFSPLQTWQRFKCAEIDFRALQFRMELDLATLAATKSFDPEVWKRYVEEARILLQKYASEHFQELEVSMKERPAS